MKMKNFTDDQIAKKKLLDKFLKKHRIYRKFYRNIRKNYEFLRCTNQPLVNIFVKFDSEDFIYGAFAWYLTIEKHEFWSNIDKLWNKYLKGVI